MGGQRFEGRAAKQRRSTLDWFALNSPQKCRGRTKRNDRGVRMITIAILINQSLLRSEIGPAIICQVYFLNKKNF